MIKASADLFSRIVQRWLPDAFIIAVILSVVIFLSGVIFEGQSVQDMAEHWGNGLWKLLGFSMQMVLILVLGSVLATSKPVTSFLVSIAKIAKTPAQGIVLVTLVSMLAIWVNWGVGLVVGALVAREVATQVKNSHFPLLIAAAYSGILVWHSGLSGAIPLKIASTGTDALSQLLNGQTIALTETIFAWQNLAITIALAVSLPIINILMMPDKDKRLELLAKETPLVTVNPTTLTPAEKLEHHSIINYLLISIGLIYLFAYFSSGSSLNLNIVNLCLLLAGLALQRTPHNYLNAMRESVGTTSGIVLQFPLYAGIMGMMVESGLAASMSQWFVEVSSEGSFPVITFFSAGIVNFFVPSGGGQWAIQAPIVIPASRELDVALNQTAMAVAWGDAWTNMIQPFWALPLLALSGLNLHQLMGYCIVILIWSGALISSMIYFLY